MSDYDKVGELLCVCVCVCVFRQEVAYVLSMILHSSMYLRALIARGLSMES